MGRGKTISKEKRAKIAAKKLKNPLASNREIAKELNTSRSSVQRIVKQVLGQLGDNRTLEALIENDLATVAIGQEAILQKVSDSLTGKNKYIFLKDLVAAVEAAGKRIMLIQGNPTERIAVTDLQGVIEDAYAELEQREGGEAPSGVAEKS